MHIPSRRVLAATAALSTALFLAGCADDDDPIASPSEPVNSATPSASAAPTVEDFCEAKAAIDAAFLSSGPPEEEGDATPSPEEVGQGISATYSSLYEEYERTAAEEVKDEVAKQVAALEEAIEDGNPEFFFDEEFAVADKAVDDFLVEECDVNEISATTVDYEFEGLPTSSPAGLTALKITNEGDEFHEIVLMRINDDVTDSIEDLLELPEEEVEGKVTPAGVVLAMPGTSAINFFDLKPGRYGVLCFISKDSDAEHEFQGDGLPHFTEGMVEELEIVDPDATPSATSSSSGSASEDEATSSPTSGSASTASEDEETPSARPTSSS